MTSGTGGRAHPGRRSTEPCCGASGIARAAMTTAIAACVVQRRSKSRSSPSQAASSAGSRSDCRRGSSAWHSGSPKRTLNSISFGPSSVSISPANRKPRNGVPRRAISARAGRMMRLHAGLLPARRGNAGRRIGAHAAGIRAGIAVADALVVLRPRRAAGRRRRRRGRRGRLPRRRRHSSITTLAPASPRMLLLHDGGDGGIAPRPSWRRPPRPCRRRGRRP